MSWDVVGCRGVSWDVVGYIHFHNLSTILDKIVGTLSNLMIKFQVPCKNVVHPPLLNVAVGEKIFVHV